MHIQIQWFLLPLLSLYPYIKYICTNEQCGKVKNNRTRTNQTSLLSATPSQKCLYYIYNKASSVGEVTQIRRSISLTYSETKLFLFAETTLIITYFIQAQHPV